MTKALTLDEARDALSNSVRWPDWRKVDPTDLCDAVEALIDAKIAIARQEIAALSDGDRTRAENAQVGEDATSADLDKRMLRFVDEDMPSEVLQLIVDVREALRSRDATIAALKSSLPDLSHVISWLENGCEPAKAADELRIYQGRIATLKEQVGK